jgi:hypothetical protein
MPNIEANSRQRDERDISFRYLRPRGINGRKLRGRSQRPSGEVFLTKSLCTAPTETSEVREGRIINGRDFQLGRCRRLVGSQKIVIRQTQLAGLIDHTESLSHEQIVVGKVPYER